MSQDPPPSLLDLPFEIRHLVLCYAFDEPAWDSYATVFIVHPLANQVVDRPPTVQYSKFSQPLFKVCRSLRRESIAAFYHVRPCSWTVDVTEPADMRTIYKTMASFQMPIERPELAIGSDLEVSSFQNLHPMLNNDGIVVDFVADETDDSRGALSSKFTPTCSRPGLEFQSPLPWLYTGLFLHLRRLRLDVVLPWHVGLAPELEALLTRIVRALDFGCRLEELTIVAIVGKFLQPAERPVEEQLSVGRDEMRRLIRAFEAPLLALQIGGSVKAQVQRFGCISSAPGTPVDISWFGGEMREKRIVAIIRK